MHSLGLYSILYIRLLLVTYPKTYSKLSLKIGDFLWKRCSIAIYLLGYAGLLATAYCRLKSTILDLASLPLPRLPNNTVVAIWLRRCYFLLRIIMVIQKAGYFRWKHKFEFVVVVMNGCEPKQVPIAAQRLQLIVTCNNI